MDNTQEKTWLKTCAKLTKALGLKKGGEPPFDLLKFLYQQRRKKATNPASQVFGSKRIDLYDNKGNLKVKDFSWGSDAIPKVEVAIAKGYWPVVERILICSSPIFDTSARGWLVMQLIGELYKDKRKPPDMELLDGTKLAKRYKKVFGPMVSLAPDSLQMIAGALAPREKSKKAKEPEDASFQIV